MQNLCIKKVKIKKQERLKPIVNIKLVVKKPNLSTQIPASKVPQDKITIAIICIKIASILLRTKISGIKFGISRISIITQAVSIHVKSIEAMMSKKIFFSLKNVFSGNFSKLFS